MKRCSLTLLILLSASTAMASGWYWIPNGDGYFLRSNYTTNDGFIYRRSCSASCRGCAKCSYVPAKVVAPVIQYTRDWPVNMTNATHSLLDKQLFLKSQQILMSLVPDAGTQSHSSQQYASSTVQRGGYPVIQQQVPESYLIAHALERVALRHADTNQQTVAALGAATQSEIEGRKQLLAYQAFGQMIQPQQVIETHTYQQQSGNVSAYGQGTNQIQALRSLTGAAGANSCASCHSGPQARSDLDIANIDSYGIEDRKAIADEALDRMIGDKSNDSSLRMPPKGPKKSPEEAAVIADYLRGEPSEQPVRQYRPTQVRPSNGPPPEPMPE